MAESCLVCVSEPCSCEAMGAAWASQPAGASLQYLRVLRAPHERFVLCFCIATFQLLSHVPVLMLSWHCSGACMAAIGMQEHA